MPDTITPNPPSPFANANPAFRHLIPTIPLFSVPVPGTLALTGCNYLAVVPDEPLRDASAGGALPDGLCPACLAEMRGETPPTGVRPVTECRTCDDHTIHGEMCVLCRQEMHDRWMADGSPDGATLDQAVALAIVAEYTTDPAPEHPGAESAGQSAVREPVAFPLQIAVFCDTCGIEVVHDYLVNDAMSRSDRLEVARTHLRTNEGWSCNSDGDFCPAHTAAAAEVTQ